MKFTNLEKIYWKKEKITKGDLIEYYASVAKFILPYLKNRPLAMHRFPDGIDGEAFFQKEAPKDLPDFVETVAIKHENRIVHYIVAQNIDTLLYVANLGSIELHLWNSTVQHLDNPDYMVIDLDPQGVKFDVVVEVAQAVHEVLDDLKMASFCKTSGGTGLHIYVPLKRKLDYEETRAFALKVATVVHEQLPTITSLERAPKKRLKKVYLDTLQNGRGALVVSPYTVRGFKGAPVSTPLEWKEVKKGLDPLDYTIDTVLERLKKKGDLFWASS
jgi:bifunctional non-homologous end joining protein LigD